MNIQGFYDYVILRDILAFILPGGISLAGIYMVTLALGINWNWMKFLPFPSDAKSFVLTVFFILISFLAGHIWDMVYRLLIQRRKWFERIGVIKKVLVGDPTPDSKSVSAHIANEIKTSLGDFLNINWDDKPIDKWIDSGKAFEASLLVSYWIEEEDPKLFSVEVGRPIIQSHFLHVCGLAFIFVGLFCVPSIAAIYYVYGLASNFLKFFHISVNWIGVTPYREFDPLTLGILFIGSLAFGVLLVLQGMHKRDIIVEHAFRVFYVIWRKRILEREAKEIVRESEKIKENRGKKNPPKQK